VPGGVKRKASHEQPTMTSYVIVQNSMWTVMLRLQSVVSCNIILVRKRNCLLVSCVIYAGESGGFDGAGAAGDVANGAGECI